MYTLGIDTTFLTTGIALVDEQNNVIFEKRKSCRKYSDTIDDLANSHIDNLLCLIKNIDNNLWKKIGNIAVTNKTGDFRSLPIGVVAANFIGLYKKKRVIGVEHEISHVYSNWINRKNNDFLFPIITLSVSGGHGYIYCQSSECDIKKIKDITWLNKSDGAPGIAAIFDKFCLEMGITVRVSGDGGYILSKLADNAEISSIGKEELKNIKLKKGDSCNFIIEGVYKVIELIARKYKTRFNGKFAENISYNFLYKIFETLKICTDMTLNEVRDVKSIHLAGGISANKIFNKIFKEYSVNKSLTFKSPVDEKYCVDNPAMVAVSGNFIKKNKNNYKYLKVNPSTWSYKYIAKKYFKL